MLKGQTFNKKRGRRNLRSDGMSWKCLAACSSSSCVTNSRPRDSFLLPAEKKFFRDFRNANIYQKTVEEENEKTTKMCVFHNYNKSFPKKRRCTTNRTNNDFWQKYVFHFLSKDCWLGLTRENNSKMKRGCQTKIYCTTSIKNF